MKYTYNIFIFCRTINNLFVQYLKNGWENKSLNSNTSLLPTMYGNCVDPAIPKSQK